VRDYIVEVVKKDYSSEFIQSLPISKTLWAECHSQLNCALDRIKITDEHLERLAQNPLTWDAKSQN
jgi:hypothetical protein